MANETITYSKNAEGWTSFWSYLPDWMIGLNNSFYTWKNGSLYKHDVNTTRNNFYSVQYNSSITSIFSQDSDAVKMFKTVAIDSNYPWQANIVTDLNTGEISTSFYKDKEGTFFSYIRRYDNTDIDLKSISTQGLGSITSYNTITLTFVFNFDIGSSISQGDTLYIRRGTVSEAQGVIASHTNRTITLVAKVGTFIPTAGDYVFIVKNAQAESYGARGYYMEVELTNSVTDYVELFSISSSVFKSYM